MRCFGINVGRQQSIYLIRLVPSFSNGSQRKCLINLIIFPGDDEGIIHWKPLQAGWFKYNVDGIVFDTVGKVSFGWVMRNDNGSFCAACIGSSFGPANALLAKALGMREVLS